MQKTLIVSLVSEQTIPNVQFVKWYSSENPDIRADMFFISTREMENKEKTRLIMDTLELSDFPCETTRIIEVDENSLVDIREKLGGSFCLREHELNIQSYGKIVLNMTGGTKIMALAAFQFFSKFENTEIYYKTFDGKIFQAFPVEREISMKPNISLAEFLTANDFEAEETGEILKSYEFNKIFYERCLSKNPAGLKLLQYPGDAKNYDGTVNLKRVRETGAEKEALKQAGNIIRFCAFDPEHITGQQIRYIMGGWFEEYVYQYIINEKGIPECNIALSLKIEHGDDKNELDVVYIDEKDMLHIVECKRHDQKKNSSSIINDAIYKLKSLTTKFGLKVKGHIYTKTSPVSQACISKANDFGIEIVDGSRI